MAGDYYSRISARFWVDTKGWGERNQLVCLYLLTNAHSTMEGLYHLPLGYLCADLGITPKQAMAALTFIEEKGVVSYDRDAEVVFVRKALKHGAPKTKNHVTGALNRLRSVPPSPLWDDFLMACGSHASDLAQGIRTRLGRPLASSGSNSPSKPPKSPQGGSDDPAPRKPKGNRKTDHAKYAVAIEAWAAQHFPSAEPHAIEGTIQWTRLDDPVTADALRAAVVSHPMWAAQLGLESEAA